MPATIQRLFVTKLETACAGLAEWQRVEATKDITLAVKVSAKQFHQGNFVDQVARMLNETGVVIPAD